MAFASLFLQAIGALVLTVAMARILPAADYIEFSLAIGAAQLIAVVVFEWLRLATIRHFPGPPEEESVRYAVIMRISILLAILVAFFGLLVGLFGVYFGLDISGHIFILVSLLAGLQGVADLRLVMVRFKGNLVGYSAIQIFRSTSQPLVSIPIALFAGQTVHVILALIILQAVAVFATFLFMPTMTDISAQRSVELRVMLLLFRQGIPSALASKCHLLLTYLIRIVGVSAFGSTASGAGFAFAMDVLQRPFPMIASLATILQFPRLVQARDSGSSKFYTPLLEKYLQGLLGCSIVCAAAIWLICAPISRFLLPEAQRIPFESLALPVVLYFFVNFVLQSAVALVPQLEGTSWISLKYAVLQLLGGIVFLFFGKIFAESFVVSLLAIIAYSLCIIMIASLKLGIWKMVLARGYIGGVLTAAVLLISSDFLLVRDDVGLVLRVLLAMVVSVIVALYSLHYRAETGCAR